MNYLFNDALGSVGTTANSAGTVMSRIYFEPFGKRINADGTAFAGAPGAVKKGFTGHEHDYEFGLINMRGRVYDPALKRMDARIRSCLSLSMAKAGIPIAMCSIVRST